MLGPAWGRQKGLQWGAALLAGARAFPCHAVPSGALSHQRAESVLAVARHPRPGERGGTQCRTKVSICGTLLHPPQPQITTSPAPTCACEKSLLGFFFVFFFLKTGFEYFAFWQQHKEQGKATVP